MPLRKLVLPAILLILSMPAKAEPKLSAWYGKDAIREGEGGEMHVVEGVEFWSNGSPPRQYKLIGYISDSRLKSGLIGRMRMKSQEKAVAIEAKKAQADAVIEVSSETETTGYVGNFNTRSNQVGGSTSGYASGYSTPVQRNHSRFAVVRYLPAAPTPAVPAVPAEANAPIPLPASK